MARVMCAVWGRALWWMRSWLRMFQFGHARRPATTEEAALLAELATMRLTLADRDALILRLRTDIEQLQATVKVHEVEMRLLVAVIERDRLRIEAEQARYAREIDLPPPS